jgi:hypothetical protein
MSLPISGNAKHMLLKRQTGRSYEEANRQVLLRRAKGRRPPHAKTQVRQVRHLLIRPLAHDMLAHPRETHALKRPKGTCFGIVVKEMLLKRHRGS